MTCEEFLLHNATATAFMAMTRGELFSAIRHIAECDKCKDFVRRQLRNPKPDHYLPEGELERIVKEAQSDSEYPWDIVGGKPI